MRGAGLGGISAGWKVGAELLSTWKILDSDGSSLQASPCWSQRTTLQGSSRIRWRQGHGVGTKRQLGERVSVSQAGDHRL